jgi:hypothetical protein
LKKIHTKCNQDYYNFSYGRGNVKCFINIHKEVAIREILMMIGILRGMKDGRKKLELIHGG